jgi:hypothetical protein
VPLYEIIEAHPQRSGGGKVVHQQDASALRTRHAGPDGAMVDAMIFVNASHEVTHFYR